VEGCVLRIYTAEDIRLDNEIIQVRLKQRENEVKIAESEGVERAAALLITRNVPIRFVDGKKLAENLQKLLSTTPEPKAGEPPPPERQFIIYHADSNSIIIRDSEDRVKEMVRLIRELDRETRQVLIEAKIVETTRNFTRDLGIQWGFLSRGITDRTFPATWGIQGAHTAPENGGQVGPWPGLSLPLSGAGNWVVNFPYSTTGGPGAAIGMTFANIANTFALDIQISAAEQNNEIRILSNPKIITSDNIEAIIESGEEVPFQTVENENVKIEFKKAVLKLRVTPHIVSEDMLNLDVHVTKDEVSRIFAVQGNPHIFTKEAKTRILMKDGDTFIIGGLIKDTHGYVNEGIPWLSRIPVLKHLFGHFGQSKTFDETMVFITPRMSPRLVSEVEGGNDHPPGGNR